MIKVVYEFYNYKYSYTGIARTRARPLQAVTAEMLQKERVMLVDMRSGTLHSGLTSPRLELETLSKLLANNHTLSILVSGSASGQAAGSGSRASSERAPHPHPQAGAGPSLPKRPPASAPSAHSTPGVSKSVPPGSSLASQQHSRPLAEPERLSASSSQSFPLRVKIRTMLLELLHKRQVRGCWLLVHSALCFSPLLFSSALFVRFSLF